LSELRNNLGVISEAVRARASEAVRKAALDIEAHAKVNAPVDTGALRNSITTEEVDDLNQIVGTNVEYSIYQEFGTVKMPAHPFLIPAAETVKPEFEKALRELMP